MAKEKKDTLKNSETSVKEETKKAKKAEKKSNKKTEDKPGFFARIGKWFKDLKIEFKNVTWPTKKTVMINSGIVLTTILVASIIVGGLDLGLLELMKFLIGLSQK
ncbi:MAG: preprotein translocase subunit SecE [Oscillospiraceae bacterium]|nr:preprotein translocase subunit SecE [Oscillospiraceae bacterium]MBR4100500.1 preprotein translocase subunit SecE [Oscillospiraceae bacterium]MBR6616733.1 preprotein translocase subunit SecE [Oscillospiraceae bacterium]